MNELAKAIVSLLAVNALIFSALFGGVWLIKRAFGKRLSAALHYALWAVVVVKLLVPVSLTTDWSPYALIQRAQSAAVRSADVAALDGRNPAPQLTDVIAVPGNPVADAAGAAYDGNPSAIDSPVPAAHAARTDWAAWIVFAWLAGACSYAAWLWLSAVRLKRKVGRCGTGQPPRWMEEAFRRCKEELGIRRDIRLVLQGILPVPAVMGAVRPVLIVPHSLAQENDREQVRHAFLHELMHVKRHDLAVIWGMNLLNAVYWFNPLVWLCIRLIHRDMETACDSMVVRRLGAEGRRDYIRTILRFSGKPGDMRVRAAMSLNDGCTGMQRRIRGMFMAGRTKGSVRAAVAALACLMVFAGFTAGCQPNPSVPPVVQKKQENLFKATPLPAEGGAPGGEPAQPAEPLAVQVAAPEKYAAELTCADGKLHLTADAAVAVPDTAAAPVLRVKAADFTQEQVDGLIRALFGGRPLYEIEHGRLSKAEIDEQILAYMRMKASDEYKSEGDQASLDETIEKLRQAREDAPDESQKTVVPSEGRLHTIERLDQYGNHVYNYTGVFLTSNPDGGKEVAMFSVENNNDLKEAIVYKNQSGVVTGMMPVRRNAMVHCVLEGMDGGRGFRYDAAMPVDTAAGTADPAVKELLKLSPADARMRGEEFLREAGIQDMAVHSLQLVSDGYDNEGNPVPPTRFAYRVLFARTAGGLPCPYLNGSAGNTVKQIEDMLSKGEDGEDSEEALKYAADWYYETMTLLLDDTGILAFDWSSPLAVEETLRERATLLDFSDILQRFEMQMQYAYEPQARQENVEGFDLAVTAVRLEMQRISEKDALGSGLLVPVWNFYGTRLVRYVEGDGEQSENGLLLTINAVDGSVIDRELGY